MPPMGAQAFAAGGCAADLSFLPSNLGQGPLFQRQEAPDGDRPLFRGHRFMLGKVETDPDMPAPTTPGLGGDRGGSWPCTQDAPKGRLGWQ